MFVSRSPQQDLVWPLVQYLFFVRMFASGLCRTTCARSLYADLFSKIFHVRISAPRSCMTTCARSLYADFLCKICVSGCLRRDPVGLLCARSLYADLLSKISLSGSLRQDPVGPLVLYLLRKISVSGCISIGPLVEDFFQIAKAQFYQRSARRTRAIRSKLHLEISKRNYTSFSRDGHARSPRRLPFEIRKRNFTSSPRDGHARSQKYCACHETMRQGHTKCSAGHAKSPSSSSSKNATPLMNSTSKHIRARHVKRNPSNDARLPCSNVQETLRPPRFSQRVRAPAT